MAVTSRDLISKSSPYTNLASRCYLKIKKRCPGGLLKESELKDIELSSSAKIDRRLEAAQRALTADGQDLLSETKEWVTSDRRDSSENLRERGNSEYKKKNLDGAITLYRRALTRCDPNYASSSDLPLCLGNLSAAYFEGKRFAASFAAANLALECLSLPDANRKRLLKRCELCQERDPKIAGSTSNVAKLGLDLKRASSSLKIEFSSSVGRHGRATQDITAGEVVLVDQPIANIPSLPLKASLCYHCFRKMGGRRVVGSPFDAEAAFCSQDCLVEAFKTYHCLESRFRAQRMFSDSYGNVDKLSTRLRLALRIAFQDQSQEEEREISSNYGVGMDIADFDANDALFGFENNFGVISEDDHLGYAVNTIILYQVLAGTGYLTNCQTSDTNTVERDSIQRRLYFNLGAINTNAHKMDSYAINETNAQRNDQTCVGAALYPVLPMLNHWCMSNTARFNVGSAVLLLATEDIAKGDEVSDCYGSSYLTQSRDERRRKLNDGYHFECQCRACAADYPKFELIPKSLSDSVGEGYNATIEKAREIFAEGKESERSSLELAGEMCVKALQHLKTNHVPFVHAARESAVLLLQTAVQRKYMKEIIVEVE